MDDEKLQKQLALAHSLLRVSQSEEWKAAIIPHLQAERDLMIETMASMTDSLQLMRYAGSIQTLTALIGLESRCRQVIESNMDKKMKNFQ